MPTTSDPVGQRSAMRARFVSTAVTFVVAGGDDDLPCAEHMVALRPTGRPTS